MTWNGRSSKPAEAGATEASETPTVITFETPFPDVPDVQIPSLPAGVTASLGEVTTEGFTLIVERDPGAEPAAIEWIATTQEVQ